MDTRSPEPLHLIMIHIPHVTAITHLNGSCMMRVHAAPVAEKTKHLHCFVFLNLSIKNQDFI